MIFQVNIKRSTSWKFLSQIYVLIALRPFTNAQMFSHWSYFLSHALWDGTNEKFHQLIQKKFIRTTNVENELKHSELGRKNFVCDVAQ